MDKEIRTIMLGYAREDFFQRRRKRFNRYAGKSQKLYREEYDRMERLSNNPDVHDYFNLGHCHGEIGKEPMNINLDPDDIIVIAYNEGYKMGQRWNKRVHMTRTGRELRVIDGGRA